MRRKGIARPSPAMVVALTALVSSLAGGAVAATLITGDDIAKRTIASKHIKPDAVKTNKVKDGTLLKQDFKAGELPTNDSPGQPAPRDPEEWKPLSLDRFENYTDTPGWATAAYRKDQIGMVHLRGLVSVDDSPFGDPAQHIGTLRGPYRPSARLVFVVATGHPPDHGRVDVTPSGDVLWIAGSRGQPDYTSLNGISFWTD